MKLVSLKRQSSEEGAEALEHAYPDAPDYPYGTRLCLDEDQLAALGIAQLPNAGADVGGQFAGTVVAIREETADGKVRRTLEIQITDLGLAMVRGSIAEIMYAAPKKDA